jgi:hypothetical protein
MCTATFLSLKNVTFSFEIFVSCIIILDAWIPDNQEFIVLVLTQSMLALLIVTSSALVGKKYLWELTFVMASR